MPRNKYFRPTDDLKEEWRRMREDNDTLGIWTQKAAFVAIALKRMGRDCVSEVVASIALRLGEIADSRFPDGIDGRTYTVAETLYAMAVAAGKAAGCIGPDFEDI